jgi:uncharacterized protein (TIGR02722 family)
MRQSSPGPVRECRALVVVGVALAVTACGTTTVYVEPGSITHDVAFTDTDLRMNAEAMVNSLVEASFLRQLDEPPLLALSGIENRTMDHIGVLSFENTIQTRLLESGRFRIVDRTVLETAAQERALASLQRIDVADAVRLGEAIGAEYFLLGEMSAIDAAHGSRPVAYKKLSMRLVDVATTEIVWADEKEIKKAAR